MMNGNENKNNDCINNYNNKTFCESFGSNDEQLKKCSRCSHLSYDGGMMMCDKFNKIK